jgi:hypothetical protein
LLVTNSGTQAFVLAGVGINNGDGALFAYANGGWRAPNAKGGNAWTLFGNSGTAAASNYLGTSDAVDLRFRTNSIERMTITATARVGINTTTPLATLDLMNGRNNSGAPFGPSNDIAFQYGNGGYRHFITTEHDAGGDSFGNRFIFWVNTGTLTGDSSAPGTGNQAVAAFTGAGSVFTTGTTNARTIAPTSALNIQDLTTGAATDTPLGIDSLGNVRRSNATKTVDTKTAAYTLVPSDANKIIAINSATPVNVTLSGLTSGQSVQVYQQGAGQVTFINGTLTRRHQFNLFATAGQFSLVEITVIGTDAALSGALA